MKMDKINTNEMEPFYNIYNKYRNPFHESLEAGFKSKSNLTVCHVNLFI